MTTPVHNPALEELGHHAERITFAQLHAAYEADKNPNRGTEEDYLARKLADGWRREESGDGIYRIVNATGGVTNTPDRSLYGDPQATNSISAVDADRNGTPEDQALAQDGRLRDEQLLQSPPATTPADPAATVNDPVIIDHSLPEEQARADAAYERNTKPLGVDYADPIEDETSTKSGWLGGKKKK